MNLARFKDTDVLSGIIFAALGVAVLYNSTTYDLGSMARMGPGFFPFILGGLLSGLGIAVALRGWISPQRSISIVRIRPVLAVGVSLVAFGAIVTRFGFAPAIVLCCVAAMVAIPRPTRVEFILLPMLLTAFCSLVFLWGLGMNIPVIRWWTP